MASKVKSGRGSKAKGSDYERELAAHFNEALGLSSRRALLSGGGRNEGGADLDGTPLIHVEAKRTERFSPYDAIEQAEATISRNSRPDFPVVIQRKNGVKINDSLVVMRLKDWEQLYAAFLKDKGVALVANESSFTAMLNGSHDGV